jgi:hypothetical protein
VRIRNTAYPDTMEISEAMIEEARAREDIEVLGGPYAPDFASPISVG